MLPSVQWLRSLRVEAWGKVLAWTLPLREAATVA
jgi:hypothetical protein